MKNGVPEGIFAASACYFAMQFANADAERIFENASEETRQEIVRLFVVERLTPKGIAERMWDVLALSHKVQLATNAGVVRRVVRQLVDETLRSQIILDRYRETLAASAETAAKARDEWMRGQGMHVWTTEENELFLWLIRRPEMHRTPRLCNHTKIAAQMNRYFRTDCFDRQLCMNHLLTLRHSKTNSKKYRENKRRKKNREGS